jgi:DNA-binding transcriptional regulator YbjK
MMEESFRASASVSPAAPASVEGAESKKRVNPMKRKQMAVRLAKVEAVVSQTEAAIADSEESLSRYVSAEETQRVSTLLEEKRRSLEALENEWAELSELLEEPE